MLRFLSCLLCFISAMNADYLNPPVDLLADQENDDTLISSLNTKINISSTTGLIQGNLNTTLNNKTISVFLGIPYAEPPIGTLRYQDTVKKEPWQGVLVANEWSANCPQFQKIINESVSSEDCLYLNIWSPKISSNSSDVKYPVLVWLHGGDFETGGSNDGVHSGDILCAFQDVVVVTFNYRLGVLGFFRLNDSNFTGNYGLKDQRVALNWIRDNINKFGGDENLITLMGTDSGAESIAYLLIDFKVKDYFFRTVLLGGSPFEPQLVDNKSIEVNYINKFMVEYLFNCSISSDETLRLCLEKTSIDTIIQAQLNLRTIPRYQVSPDIDGLTVVKDPWKAFSEKQFLAKDLILGSTNNEGVEKSIKLLREHIHNASLSLTNERLLNESRNAFYAYPKPVSVMTGTGRNYLTFQYTQYQDPDDGDRNFRIFSESFGDYATVCPIVKTARAVESLHDRVFLYYFTEDEGSNVWNGSSHGEDSKYLFGYPLIHDDKFNENQRNLTLKMMRYFVSFAKSGLPTNDDDVFMWNPLGDVDKGQMNYYEFNSENSRNYSHGFRLNECHWWTETLDYVNKLVEPIVTTTTRVTSSSTTSTEVSTELSTDESTEVSTQSSTEAPPIGPRELRHLCRGRMNNAAYIILSVMLPLQVICLIALIVLVRMYFQKQNQYLDDNMQMSHR